MSLIRSILTILLINAVLVPSPGLAASNVERYPLLADEIAKQIRTQQMRCNTMTHIDVHAQTERGDVFYVICDQPTHHYRYRVLIRPDGSIFARPWSE